MSSVDEFGLVGTTIDGHLRIDAFIGEGDLSYVYRGQHLGLDAPVAIKCLNVPSTLDQALVSALLKEFREGSALHYRLSQGSLHIARAITSGTVHIDAFGIDVPYLVREWLDGESLATEFATRRAEGMTGRTLAQVIELFAPVADALEYAHGQGVIHQRVNPFNLFVVKEPNKKDVLKVLDFGVAKAIHERTPPRKSIPPTDGKHGDRADLHIVYPAYAAPEQLDRTLGAVGPQTDVYALALLVLEGLRDKPAIAMRATVDWAAKILDKANRPIPKNLGLSLSRSVELVLERAVALEPHKRQGTIKTFWGDLTRAAQPVVRTASSSAIRAVPPRGGVGSIPLAEPAKALAANAEEPPPGSEAPKPPSSAPQTKSNAPTRMGVPVLTPHARADLADPFAKTETAPATFKNARIPRLSERASGAAGSQIPPPSSKTSQVPPSAKATEPPTSANEAPVESLATVPVPSPLDAEPILTPSFGPLTPRPPPGSVATMLGMPAPLSGSRGAIIAPSQRPAQPTLLGLAESAPPLGTKASAPPETPSVPGLAVSDAQVPSATPTTSRTDARGEIRLPFFGRTERTKAYVVGGAILGALFLCGVIAIAILFAFLSSRKPQATTDAPQDVPKTSTSAGASETTPVAPIPTVTKPQPPPEVTKVPVQEEVVATKPFDKAAAQKALSSVSVDPCKRPGGKTGKGLAKVVFSPLGTVSEVVVLPPFAKTPEATCLATRYKEATIPAFKGKATPWVATFHIK